MAKSFKDKIAALAEQAAIASEPFRLQAVAELQSSIKKALTKRGDKIAYIGHVNSELVVGKVGGGIHYSMSPHYPRFADRLNDELTELIAAFGWPEPFTVTNKGEVIYKR